MGLGRKGERVAKTPTRVLPPSRGGPDGGGPAVPHGLGELPQQPDMAELLDAPQGAGVPVGRFEHHPGPQGIHQAALAGDAKFFGKVALDVGDSVHGKRLLFHRAPPYRLRHRPTALPSICSSASWGPRIDHGRADGGVVGQQNDGVPLAVEVFQRGLLADADRRDLSLFHFGLAADADDVPVLYGGGHAVAVTGQGEVGVPVGRHPDVPLDVLFRSDGGAAGDGPHQGHPRHPRHGLESLGDHAPAVFQPQQPGGGSLQGGGKVLQLVLGDVVDPFFDLGDGGLGPVAHPGGQLLLAHAQFLPAQPDTGR